VVIESVAVVGSGLMGRGIAHAAALGGFRTALHDVSGPALEEALAQIRRDLDEGLAKGGGAVFLAQAPVQSVYEYDRR
jgi:3-hydroxybutyryl-CoA dehydrogenase